LKNNNDFDEVVKAYGVREVSSGFGNIFVPNYNGNLIGAIKNEMKSSQIQKINDILKGNGISKKIV